MTTAGFEQARAPECDPLFFRWRALTVALLILGYAGYYLCRFDLSLTIPLLTAELASHGISPADARVRLGGIASLGVLAYAPANSPLAGSPTSSAAAEVFCSAWPALSLARSSSASAAASPFSPSPGSATGFCNPPADPDW